MALVLVLLNGFFVAVEFAMVKARSSRIDALALEGNIRAKFASRILGNMNAYLSACQLGITLTSLVLGWLGEPTIARIIEPLLTKVGMPQSFIHIIAFIIGFTIVTAFHITIGEQVPKTYAIRKSEAVTLWSAIPMMVFFKIMYPFIWVLNGASNWMLRKSGVEPEAEHDAVHTEEEIRLLVKESHKSGLIDNTELTLVDNVFEFTETVAREIMIPRTELACLYADRTFEENMEIATTEMRTRYPVCDPDKDNIIGFIHIKDLFKSREGIDNIRSIIRPIMSIPESMPISALLKMMQKKRTEVALLIDEYGGTSGLVTMEDILEELVGEIHDEFDDEERSTIEKKDEYTHSVDGLLHIEEFNDYFGLDIETDDYDTIGGWVYSQVEIPPKKNQKVYFKEYELTVDEVDHMRVSRLVVRRMAENSEGENSAVMPVVS
ncbi:hemolysin family protein [Paenibacillus ginsengarvi]|uniref:hemolysin family protein n=1 Tax=Paenibacillus ginsengarvi TaxID=400777 RepID=UPI001F007130|nr:hemolysin family protein [Paenibacillus ginsengarvi]